MGDVQDRNLAGPDKFFQILRSGERFGYLPQELPKLQRKDTIYEYLTATDRFYDWDPRDLAQLCAKIFKLLASVGDITLVVCVSNCAARCGLAAQLYAPDKSI